MATASTLDVMTLGPQQKAMTSLIQPTSNASGCVIVTAQQPQPGHASPHQAPKGMLLQQKRPLAPADARAPAAVPSAAVAAAAAAAAAASPDMLRCKRRINFSHTTHLSYAPGHQPASVARRNARERNRVKQVNNGFATLRSRIPLSVAAALSSTPSPASGRGASKKLSKVETLRMAVEYIRSLQQLLEDHAAETASTASSSASSTTPEPAGGSGGGSAGAPASDTGYYSSSPESAVALGPAGSHYPAPAAGAASAAAGAGAGPGGLLGAQTSLSPPCSEASSSPTPSYASEGSGSGGGSGYAPPSVYQPDAYDNYEPMSPEDEELLDVISWWQQSQ